MGCSHRRYDRRNAVGSLSTEHLSSLHETVVRAYMAQGGIERRTSHVAGGVQARVVVEMLAHALDEAGRVRQRPDDDGGNVGGEAAD
jgi:hypothetical protein